MARLVSRAYLEVEVVEGIEVVVVGMKRLQGRE